MLLTFSVESLLVILVVIVLVSLVTRKFHLPYTVALVFAGFFSSLLSVPLLKVPPETFLTILLPPLVFEAAYHLNFSNIKENIGPIVGLAFIGTFLSTFLVGVFTYFLLKLNFFESLLLGAIVSPTDAVAVVSILHELNVSKALISIIEGEALFNDGVAVVLYSTTISALKTSNLNLIEIVGDATWSITVGTLAGIIVGYLTCKIVQAVEDKFTQIIVTFIAAYSSYQLASYLNGSGIVSTTIAGLVIGNFIHKTQKKENLEAISLMWDFVSFIITSISFTLVGVYIEIPLLLGFACIIVVSIIIVLLSRAIMVHIIMEIMSIKEKSFEKNWKRIIVWSGIRGVISIMLVLGLPTLPIPHAKEIVAIVFGVVFFSIVFQGHMVKFIAQKQR